MGAASVYLKIYQGRTYTQRFKIVDQADPPAAIDLTGKTITGSVKNTFGGTVLATYTIVILDQTQPTTKGCFEISLTAIQTLAIPFGPDVSLENRATEYPTDFYITEPSTDKIPLMIGIAALVAEVTP